uniref:Uncharacterized protein n=1 Tax=Meloidogyne enterolobii TaxID=390850 RepID=A0A6V7UNQ0_MELEN|nr:unnamed protein product [Meloidogyne enterolobii]
MAENNSDRGLELYVTNNKFNKTMSELAGELEELKNFVLKKVCFVQVPNKWRFICDGQFTWEFVYLDINSYKFVKSNEFLLLTDDKNNKYYIKCEQSVFGWLGDMFNLYNGLNKESLVLAQNTFNKPTNDCSTFALFYY